MISFWLGLFILVVFFILLRLFEDWGYYNWWDFDTDGAITGILTLVSLALLAHAFFTLETSYGDDYAVEESVYSMRITDTPESSISGAFMLGFGAVNGSSKSKPAYWCYTGDDTNGYLLEDFDAQETRLIPSPTATNGKVSRWYKNGVRFFEGNFLFGVDGIIEIGGKWNTAPKLQRITLTLPEDYIQFNYETITN